MLRACPHARTRVLPPPGRLLPLNVHFPCSVALVGYCLVLSFVFVATAFAAPSDFAPGRPFFALAVAAAVGHAFGVAAECVGLPAPLGMVAAGLGLNNLPSRPLLGACSHVSRRTAASAVLRRRCVNASRSRGAQA